MDAERVFKRTLAVAALFFASVIALGVATQPDDRSGPSDRPAATSRYSHDELQRSADMTQRMSGPDANTGHAVHSTDEQLQRSQQDPGYVGELEQHQADLDRMLARGEP